MVKADLADVLSEFARTMVTDFPIERILDRLVERIVDIMPITGAAVTLISDDLHPQYLAASTASALRYEQLQSELGEGPSLVAYQTGEAVAVQDLNDESSFPNFASRALIAGLVAVFTFPLRHGDALLGALDLYRDTPGPLTPESLSTAQTLADVAAAYLINARARSELEESSEQSRDAAMHDGLTGLPNRALLTERLEHALVRVQRSDKTIAVFFIDLDGFKAINDKYGHQVGDALLVAVGERLAGVLRPGDSLARLAGDEFVVLCEELDDPAQADAIAVRVDGALSRPFAVGGVLLQIRGSIGIACSLKGDTDPGALIHEADMAMYRAKRRYGPRRHVRKVRARDAIARQVRPTGLPGALKRGDLQLSYQPIVDTATGRFTAAEALVRWPHASRDRSSPTTFVPLAEQSGRIIEIGHWVRERACQARQRWEDQAAGEISMSVNVSARQFMSAGFVRSVTSALHRNSTRPDLLTLEVPESVVVHDRERALIVLEDLKAAGVRLALDGFGTGYSSLNDLQRLPIDTIKIDGSFVVQLSGRAADQAVVTAIIQLAHGLGMTVVSEGVETAEQHQQLTMLGSDCCQGVYFSSPMSAAGIESLLSAENGSVRLPLVSPSEGR